VSENFTKTFANSARLQDIIPVFQNFKHLQVAFDIRDIINGY